jgi:acyl carrier protein
MSHDKRKQQLIEFIEGTVVKGNCTTKIKTDTGLFSEHVLNSMNILDLIGYVRKTTGKELSEDDLVMSKWSSVDTICENFL